MSLDPKIWGSSMWTTLLTTALGYPEVPSIDDIYHYKRWYYHLQFVLPCETCRKNFKDHIRKVPIDHFLKSRSRLLIWVTQMHNLVANDLGKKTLTVKEMVKQYVKEYNGQIGGSIGGTIPSIIVTLIIVFIFYKFVLRRN